MSVDQTFITEWHRCVREQDIEGLGDLLADDISMGAPPYWDLLSGKELVHHLLGLIVTTIDDFTYHREWHGAMGDDGQLALEFKGHVGELDLQGIDLISINDDGKIQHLDVMIRPINALEALQDTVGPKMIEFFSP